MGRHYTSIPTMLDGERQTGLSMGFTAPPKSRGYCRYIRFDVNLSGPSACMSHLLVPSSGPETSISIFYAAVDVGTRNLLGKPRGSCRASVGVFLRNVSSGNGLTAGTGLTIWSPLFLDSRQLTGTLFTYIFDRQSNPVQRSHSSRKAAEPTTPDALRQSVCVIAIVPKSHNGPLYTRFGRAKTLVKIVRLCDFFMIVRLEGRGHPTRLPT